MSEPSAWWNGLSWAARRAWLSAHRLRTSIYIFTWHCLREHDRRRIEQAWKLEAS